MMRGLRRLAVLALLALAAGCSTFVSAPALPTPTTAAAQASWARVLERFVNDRGEVDFQALASDRGDLDIYLRHIADMQLDRVREGPERLAHMINAYNALSMGNVIDSGIPHSHDGWNKVRFFVLRKFEVGGARMSLYAFENDVIRPAARQRVDPRVHFALNCSARSCPQLPRRPFAAARLDAELEGETRAFFARPENFRLDHAARTVWLSAILDFYTEDFVPQPAGSLTAYANRYAPEPAPLDFTVRFSPYDWTIASSRPTTSSGL